MENIRYEYYSPKKGYEEIQAHIYNTNTKGRVIAKDIEHKIMKEKKDPKLLRYAFSEEGKPLAYIQASQVSSSVFYLGYPWCLPDCPSSVQEKLFTDMLEYIKTKNIDEIQYWINAVHKEAIAFFEAKGFKQQIRGVTYKFNLQKLREHNLENPEKYSTHLATKEDVDLLVEIGTADKELQQAGLTGEWLRDYFETKVLTDGHCVIVKDKDKIISASAPLRDPIRPESNIILRFTATRPGYEDVWPYLIVEIAKECIEAGWDLPLHVNVEDESKVAAALLPLNPKISESYHLYVLNLKK
jgi:NACalpha-BTF3-like transcription factor